MRQAWGVAGEAGRPLRLLCGAHTMQTYPGKGAHTHTLVCGGFSKR